MTPEESARADMTDMRCLTLCIAMLERVHGVRIQLFLWFLLLYILIFDF